MPSSAKSSSSPLATFFLTALAVTGIAVAGAQVLDWHAHTCVVCGREWKHFGAFNLGDEKAHTCARCGSVQWMKNLPPSMRGLV